MHKLSSILVSKQVKLRPPLIKLIISLVGITCFFLSVLSPVIVAQEKENQAYYQALALYHQKNWDDAKVAFKKIIQQNRQTKWHASILLRLADMAETSEDAIKGYLKVLKDYGESEWAQDAQWGLASTYFALGQYKKVITTLETVKSNNSSRGLKALHTTGLALLALKDYEQAKLTFQNLIKQASTDKFKQDGLVGLGDAYIGLKEFGQALITYDRYIKAYPNGQYSNHILKQKSQLLTTQGSHDDAVATMHQLATRYPDSYEAEKVKNKLSDQQSNEKYTIQVGSFSKKNYATILEKKLRKKGYNAYQLQTRRHDDVFSQVRVGHYTTKAFAQSIAEKLKENEKLPYVIVPYIKPTTE